MVSKDGSYHGFVPRHTHGTVDYTSVNDGHVHQCLDVTSPPIPSQDGTHIHYSEGYVVFENGHNHHYQAYSGPAIPVGDGRHVHYTIFTQHKMMDIDITLQELICLRQVLDNCAAAPHSYFN